MQVLRNGHTNHNVRAESRAGISSEDISYVGRYILDLVSSQRMHTFRWKSILTPAEDTIAHMATVVPDSDMLAHRQAVSTIIHWAASS